MASRSPAASDAWTVERLGADGDHVTVQIGPHPKHETCLLLTRGDRTIEVPVDEDGVAQPHDPVPEWAHKPLRQLGVHA